MNKANDLIGKWGIYQWFVEHGTELIHPEDLDNFKALQPNGKVFKCINDDGNFITLEYADMQYRVRNDIFKPVDEPVKTIGEKVELKEIQVGGIVIDITWHFQCKAHIYCLEINGRKKSKRYWAEDFKL